MTHPKRTDLTVRLERAVLAGVVLPDEPVTAEERLEELAQLAKTAGARIVSRVSQRRTAVDSSYFIGKGKAGELREAAKAAGADVIIFDHDLTPGQLRNLEGITDTKVVDRSELILDIFATHARSAAAKVQVAYIALRADGEIGAYAINQGFQYAHFDGQANRLIPADHAVTAS